MTSIFASWTVGAALLYSAIKNMSMIELLKGEPGPGQPESIVEKAMTRAASIGPVPKSKNGGTTAPASKAAGVGTYDGKQVAKWIIPWLEKARKKGWSGSVTSGYRDPAYSEQLCLNMCGAPSCPGKCAGRSSNHSGKKFPAGAIDVSDYVTFGRIMKELRAPLKNSLGPADPVHFSVSGS